MRKVTTFAVAITGIGVIGVIDYVTGYEVRVFPLYFLPVALVAARISRTSAVVLSAFGAAAWALSNAFAGRVYTSDVVLGINVCMQFVAFATVGVLVAELQRQLARERDLGRLDTLTGLPNRRAFCERGEPLLALARRARRPITLAYVDLDNFKQVNDERGHREGDRVLILTAEVLRAVCRSTDLVGRLGGDEFVVLLPDTGADAAGVALERVQTAFAAAMEAGGYPCTASIGAAAYSGAPATLEAAIHDADEVMYRAKTVGKNRVLIEPFAGAPAPPLAA